MTWRPRLKPLAAAAAAVFLATAGLAARGFQPPAPQGARDEARTTSAPKADAGGEAGRALAKEQLVLIDNASEVLRQMAEKGLVETSDPRFALWGRRRVETLRQTGAGKAEVVAALETYIKGLKQEEEIAAARRQAARASMLDVYDARYRRMEAEGWLNEEKAR